MPNFVPTQARHGREHRILGWMNVAGRDSDLAVSRDPGQRPNVATGLSEACQKRVSKGVEHEGAHVLLIALRCLFRDPRKRLRVLLTHRMK